MRRRDRETTLSMQQDVAGAAVSAETSPPLRSFACSFLGPKRQSGSVRGGVVEGNLQTHGHSTRLASETL